MPAKPTPTLLREIRIEVRRIRIEVGRTHQRVGRLERGIVAALAATREAITDLTSSVREMADD